VEPEGVSTELTSFVRRHRGNQVETSYLESVSVRRAAAHPRRRRCQPTAALGYAFTDQARASDIGLGLLQWQEDKDAESQDFAPNSPAFLERAPEVTPRIVARSAASAPRRLLITGLINNKSFPIRRYRKQHNLASWLLYIQWGTLPSPLMAPSTIHILHAGRMHFVPYPSRIPPVSHHQSGLLPWNASGLFHFYFTTFNSGTATASAA
jgi:hypothetical protein